MRLLLAEDEKALAKALKAILERSNYSVDAVYDGEAALEYMAAGNYDGIILDIMMPKKDGLTVLKEIRKKGSKIPVLLLTAKGEVDDKVEGLDAGANDYLTKPFHAKELLARLRAMTRVQMESEDSQLKAGNVTLDRATFELTTPKGSIRLANKEYQMMEFLMSNPGHLISSERFFEKIWGYDSEAELNVVWVYLSNLRKKLSSLDADIQVRATRNAGYSLEELK
ncbi:response regulator transcription factor [Faecalimonas umbilicata]|uniref:response regulator transcription factor n=1 Tax=Faecalimonas umbilicata TaxID=1912855 RepID=UPI0039936B75